MKRLPRLSHVLPLLVTVLVVLPAVLAMAGCGGGSQHAAAASPATAASPGRVVATVDGSPVRAGDVDLVHAERRLLGQPDSGASALREAIERNLMHREAARLGVSAAPATVRGRMAEIESRYGGGDALRAALDHAGMSHRQLQQSVADGVLREALRNAKFPGLRATAAEVSRYYRRNKTRLFTTPAAVHLGAIEVRTRMVAEDAIARLRQGRPFAEVARQLSIDPQSKDAGGDLGWVLTSSLPPAARRDVMRAHGVLMRPFSGNGVWYVFSVFARRARRAVPFTSVQGRIRAELTDVARSRALQAWLKAARGRATITTP
jgi:parvulin-like peptidyl-prolyl isomerase